MNEYVHELMGKQELARSEGIYAVLSLLDFEIFSFYLRDSRETERTIFIFVPSFRAGDKQHKQKQSVSPTEQTSPVRRQLRNPVVWVSLCQEHILLKNFYTTNFHTTTNCMYARLARY